MLKINISKQAAKFLKNAQQKHSKQIARKLLLLQENPIQHDSIQLKGNYSKYKRCDIGEYRVIYFVESQVLHIVLIGKRNDGEVYKLLDRI